MKTAKSIIVVLSVLLTAQVALAFYCPATGRWLSRDPIGEPGFQLLQQVSQTTHAPAVMPSSSRWIHRDSADGNSYAFVHNNSISYVDPVGLFDWEGHYFFGHGDPVDLGDINLGHLFEAEPSVVGAVNEFNDMLFTVAKHKASKLCVKVGGNPSINFPWSNKTVTDVTSNPGLFPVGHSTFFEKAKCRLTVDCCKKTFKVQCNNRYAIRDWFADPLDGGFEIPGGTPYRINYSFTRFFSSGGGFQHMRCLISMCGVVFCMLAASGCHSKETELCGDYRLVRDNTIEVMIYRPHGHNTMISGYIAKYAVKAPYIAGFATTNNWPNEESLGHHGFFVINTKTDSVFEGLSDAQWKEELKKIGWPNPQLVEP